MKTTLTFILLIAATLCFSQSKQDKINKAADFMSSNMIKQADTAFAQLNREYPGDSLVLRAEAITYWKYGRVKDNVKLLDHSLKQFKALESKYPGNAEFNLFIATANTKKCDVSYFSHKTPEIEKKALLSEYKSLKADIEKYSAQLDPLKHGVVSIAKQDLSNIQNRIEQLK